MASRVRDIAAASDTYENRESVERQSVGRTPQLDSRVIRPTGIDAIISGLDDFLKVAKDSVSRETLRAAQRAGSEAGLSDEFREREDNTLAAEAYNKAGVQIYLNRTTADMTRRVNETAANPQLRNDPVALRHALEDLGGEIGKNVPQSIYPDFMVAYNTRMQQALLNAQERAYSMQISENEAAFMEAEVSLLAEATNAARTGNEQVLATTQQQYLAAIDGQIGLSISPAEAMKKKLLFAKQIRSDAVVGDFLRTPPEARLGFVRDFIKNNPLGDILTAEEVDGLKRDMMTAWDVNENLADKADLERTAATRAAADNVLAQFHLAPTPENYTAYISMPGVTAANIKAARSYLTSNLNKSDPVMQSFIEDAIFNGDVAAANDILNSPEGSSLIKRQDMQRYRKQLADQQSGGGFEDTEAYKEVLKRIGEDYRQQTAYGPGLSRQGNMLRQQIYDKLRTDYPKYLRGELSFDDIDPVRMYNLKRQNLEKTAEVTPGGAGRKIKTSNGDVTIPQSYLDDPVSYVQDVKAGTISPHLATIDVQKFMAEHDVERMAQQKATQK